MRRRAWIARAAAGAIGVAGARWLAACARGAGAALPSPLGVQLYTVRALLAEDIPGTLGKVAAIGYREVELAGLHGATPTAFRAHLDDAGLVAPSSHVALGEVRADLDRLLEDASTLGVRMLIVPWLDAEERSAEGYRKVADDLEAAGSRASEAGIRVGYHNQAYDHDPLDSGTGWDLLLQRTEPSLVTMQMDAYWAVAGGIDPLAALRDHAGRFTSIHAKDRSADGAMVDVGDGTIDFAAILVAGRAQGLEHVFAEHDEPRDPLASIRSSYDHLAALES
ncbi:MAG TPA: sugar phosphate isomerase/epimerase [Longimicrobiales bacterium]|nr:sugar phosphate isomerase/epimerase [Longimicrobiales bacterium]